MTSIVRSIIVYIASLLETRLDGIISTFTKLDGKLEAYIERTDSRIESERAIRTASMNRTAEMLTERERAERIRVRVRDIVG